MARALRRSRRRDHVPRSQPHCWPRPTVSSPPGTRLRWAQDVPAARRDWRECVPMRLARLTFLLALVAVGCLRVDSQTQTRTPIDGRPLLFRGARVIVGDGRVIDDGAFVLQGGLLMQVGRSGQLTVPSNAVAIDVRGKTIMPAIVNAHSHLGWEKYTSWGSQNFTRDNLIDHLYRHAYYGIGTVISTASDRESIALPV